MLPYLRGPSPKFHTHPTIRLSPQRGLLVTPVVAFIDESFSPRPNPAEVSAIFYAPLELFISKKSHKCLDVFSGQLGFKHFFHYDDLESGNSYHIWGLTALLAVLVSTLALRKKPEFDIFYDIADPLPFFKQALHQKISKLWTALPMYGRKCKNIPKLIMKALIYCLSFIPAVTLHTI